MPFALLTIGMLLIITGFQNTYKEFGQQLADDFTGQGNFIYWVFSIGAVGAIGYYKPLETFSRTFLALIIVAMFLTNKNQGFFNRLTESLGKGTEKAVDIIGAPLPAAGGGGASASGGVPGLGGAGDFVNGFVNGFGGSFGF